MLLQRILVLSKFFKMLMKLCKRRNFLGVLFHYPSGTKCALPASPATWRLSTFLQSFLLSTTIAIAAWSLNSIDVYVFVWVGPERPTIIYDQRQPTGRGLRVTIHRIVSASVKVENNSMGSTRAVGYEEIAVRFLREDDSRQTVKITASDSDAAPAVLHTHTLIKVRTLTSVTH